MRDLTFYYIYFSKLFCQNRVKKNCKFVVRVFKKSNTLFSRIPTYAVRKQRRKVCISLNVMLFIIGYPVKTKGQNYTV